MLDVLQRVWSVSGCYDRFKFELRKEGAGGGSEDEVLEFKILSLDECQQGFLVRRGELLRGNP